MEKSDIFIYNGAGMEQWVDDVLESLDTEELNMIRPQASYLIYLDCRGLGLTQEELVRLFVDKAHLALNDRCV